MLKTSLEMIKFCFAPLNFLSGSVIKLACTQLTLKHQACVMCVMTLGSRWSSRDDMMIPRRRFTNFVSKRKKNGEHWASDDQGSVQMMYVGRFVLKEKYYILICTVDMLVEKYWKKRKEEKRNRVTMLHLGRHWIFRCFLLMQVVVGPLPWFSFQGPSVGRIWASRKKLGAKFYGFLT
jgi:hypothetical protein